MNLLFHTGHAVKLLNRSRRTIYRWIKAGQIKSNQSPISHRHLFALEEINRIRTLEGMITITPEQAKEIWETW